MKVLVLADDYWHPSDVVMAGLAPLMNPAREFTLSQTADDFDDYDVILLCKSNRVSADDEGQFMEGTFADKLTAFVEGGGGLLVVHAGIVAPNTSDTLYALIGSKFDHHPEQCVVSYEPKGEHPVVQGVQVFSCQDEHYFITLDEHAQVDIFLSSVSEHGSQVAGYAMQRGRGRIAVLTPGHNEPVWLDVQMQRLLVQALDWCGRRDACA